MHTATRTDILAAASRRFSTQGFHATSVSQIIGDVGMAQGSFYNYFRNKRAIFDEVLRQTCDDICRRVEAVPFVGVNDKETYAQAGIRIAEALVAYFSENRDAARLFLWDAPGLDREADAAIAAAYARIASYSTKYLEHGQALGIVRAELAAQIVAQGLIGMCAHLSKVFISGGFAETPPDKIAGTILSVHLHGIFA